MLKSIACLIALCLAGGLFAQRTDSLKHVLKTAKRDTALVYTYKELISELEDEGNYKEASDLNEQLFLFSKTIKFAKGYGFYYMFKGCLLEDDHYYEKSIPAHYRAVEIFDSLKMAKTVAIEYRHIADNYVELANYKKAVEFIFKEIRIEQNLKELKLLSGAYLNIGNAYRKLEDYVHAETFYQKSFEIKNEIHDSMGIANCYNNLGLIYRHHKDYRKALGVYFKALGIYQNLKNDKGIIRSYTNIGVVYKSFNNLSNALTYFNKAIDLSRKIGYRSSLTTLYNNVANLYIIQHQPDKAIPLLDTSIKISETEKDIEDLYTAHEYLSKAYFLKSDYKNAYLNHVMFKQLHDSIYNDENSKTISDLRTRFEVEKKEVEVKAIANAEKQKLADIAKVQRNRSLMIIIGVVSLLVITMVFLWILNKRFRITNRQKQVIEKQKEVLDEKNNLLEEKQKEIIDSINYAKRLQQAILPPSETLKKYFPESFILYKPKDIVAGDFYWMHTLLVADKEMVFIAAADSTGHGVPGAMVSVVCSNALNRAVVEFGLTDTGAILDKTRELVLETFSKSGEEIKDGMDISLCKFEIRKQDLKVQWSGANNPLWYIQNGQLLQIKADKQAIGKTDNPTPFKTHDIVHTPGTTYYLLTDGFADQFGGPKGKKFKHKQLEDVLLQLHHSDLLTQKNQLDMSFNNWKGDLEQVDDVTIIGIKI
ncbi:MAG: tetratricopeptide repeat protein [Bacteroidetes bacterium]|nr:tetratricopeptide repeat protein [Bacteroidota bacterium]